MLQNLASEGSIARTCFEFLLAKVAFFEHVLNAMDILVDPSKVSDMLDLPRSMIITKTNVLGIGRVLPKVYLVFLNKFYTID